MSIFIVLKFIYFDCGKFKLLKIFESLKFELLKVFEKLKFI